MKIEITGQKKIYKNAKKNDNTRVSIRMPKKNQPKNLQEITTLKDIVKALQQCRNKIS